MRFGSFKMRKWTGRIFSVLVVLLMVLVYARVATAAVYADSAHGDDSTGVNRSTATCENWPGGACVTGSCAHCHDTFDPAICGVNALMLFEPDENPTPDPQSENFCYECHGSGSAQAVTNHSYSKNFGGGTATLTTIYHAFNPPSGATPSSHDLADVLSHAVDRGIGFTNATNPCLVCHDQHASQKNYPVVLTGTGGVKTAVRRPADYAISPTNLWGDDEYAISGYNERMSDFSNKYQAPYYVGGLNYEPANDSTFDGSNLPNFKNFCTDQCHGLANVYSTERAANLIQIDWGTSGDLHGRGHDPDEGMGYTIAPYTDEDYNYHLSCTDCHEPHGSENEWLLRTCVNGKDNISVPTVGEVNGNWWDFCTACHVLTDATDMYHRKYSNPAPSCPTCHFHGFPEGF